MNERIKQVRKSLGITQQAFAERIGMKQNSIALVESGKRNISGQALLSICREFQVNELWLRTGEGEMFMEMSEEDEIAAFVGSLLGSKSESFKKRFVAAISQLDEDDWIVLEKMAEKMKKD